MKKLLTVLSLAVLLAGAGCFNGCGTLDKAGPYSGNKVLYQSDLTLATAYDIIDGFLVWEMAHRGKPECPPSVTAAADSLRAKAPSAFTTALAARDVYAQASNSTNQDALMTALAALQGLVAIANQNIIPQLGK